ncbi:hypothetical protein ABW19_dt0207006 [Dactylella cylindrospora]|nr:hypothetical protein ABW19_dt0207006 [Dactylella cylindrospora]
MVQFPDLHTTELAVFLRYDYKNKNTKCLVIGSHSAEVQENIEAWLAYTNHDLSECLPMLFLSRIADIYSARYQEARTSLFWDLFEVEKQSGITWSVLDEVILPEQYRDLIKRVHKISITFARQECAQEFEVRWSKALLQIWEELKFVPVEAYAAAGSSEPKGKALGEMIATIEASLDIIATRAAAGVERMKMLQTRSQIQERAINILINTTDISTSIALAKDAKRNSDSMRVIAIVTMLYLPGAFVSGIFGMVFFDISGDTGKIFATPDAWLFAAVTVPLTLLTLFISQIWFEGQISRAWARLRGIRGRRESESKGGSESDKRDA